MPTFHSETNEAACPMPDRLFLCHIPYEVVDHSDLLLLLSINYHRIVDVDLFDERGDDFWGQSLNVRELPDKADELVRSVRCLLLRCNEFH